MNLRRLRWLHIEKTTMIYFPIIFAIASFLFFGSSCLLFPRMRTEFQRYGIPQFRVVTGVLQILGAIGLLVGFYVAWLGLASSIGLFLLMSAGVVVRRWIKDSWLQSIPAIFYMLLSASLAVYYSSLL